MVNSGDNRAKSRNSKEAPKDPDQLLREALRAMSPDDPRYEALETLAYPPQLPERLYAALPSNDPRFARLRAHLTPLQARGSKSPIPTILGDLARVGFDIVMGYAGERQSRPEESQDLASLADARETAERRAKVAKAAEGFDFG